jgi:hypothetical protein
MSHEVMFIHIGPGSRIVELPVPEHRTEAALYSALKAAELLAEESLLIFIDEAEEDIQRDRDHEVHGLKHGCRIHVSHCKRVEVTVHYLEKTAERKFAPGTRVRAVKQWATHEFHVDPKDAPEHVLQICNSKERPSSDTPLSALVHDRHCGVCFDLVPEKRVEG